MTWPKHLLHQLRSAWQHAFSLEPAQPLSDEDAQFLCKIAGIVRSRRLELPVSCLIEACRPVQYVSGQTMRMFHPLLATFVSASELELLTKILENRESADRFLELLDRSTVVDQTPDSVSLKEPADTVD